VRSGTGQSGLRHRCGGCVSHLCSKPLDILDRAIRVLNFFYAKNFVDNFDSLTTYSCVMPDNLVLSSLDGNVCVAKT